MGIKPRSQLTDADRRRMERLQRLAGDVIDKRHLKDMSPEAERKRLVAEASAKCDERFPLMVRDASLSDPAVCDWVDRFKSGTIHDHQSLMISGAVGAGKTWQAYAALRNVATSPRVNPRTGFEYLLKWRSMTFSQFAASIRPQHGADLRTEFDALIRVPLLMIDDFGSGKITEAVEDATYMLVDYRLMHKLPCIFTTNLGARDFKDVVGDRTTSRLRHMCERVVMKGHDRREAGVY